MPLKQASQTLGQLVEEAAFDDKIVPITRRGREVAALIGRRDLERLRKLGVA